MRRGVQRLSQIIPVLEAGGVERRGTLQVRDGLRRILLKPPGDTQVVLRGSKLRIQDQSPLEALDSLVPAVEHREQEADLILYARRPRIDLRCLLPCRQRARSVSPSLQRGGARLDFLQPLLTAHRQQRPGQKNR